MGVLNHIPRNPILPVGRNVEVYWNLHKDVFSVRDMTTRKVIGHCDRISLDDVTFRVSEPGRQRVLAEKRKNVHAFVRGRVSLPVNRPDGESIGIRYNPHEAGHFQGPWGEEVYGAAHVSMHGGKIYGYKLNRGPLPSSSVKIDD